MSNDHIYTDSEREHIEQLSAEYVLGTLTEDEEGLKEFESLVESGNPVLSKTLEQMLAASLSLAMAVPQVDPPAGIRSSLLDKIEKTKQNIPSAEDHSKIPSQDAVRLKRRTRYFIGTSVLSGLLLCLLVAMNVTSSAKLDRSNVLMKGLMHQIDSLRAINSSETASKQTDSLPAATAPAEKENPELGGFLAMFGENDARIVTLASAPLGTTRQHLFFSPKQQRVAVLREHLPPLEGNKTYELWATVGHKAPIAIGTFRVDSKKTPSIINFSTKLKAADSFAISIEPGSVGDTRKGSVIFIGSVPKAGIN
jgi:anti-sigma-K factor RskA